RGDPRGRAPLHVVAGGPGGRLPHDHLGPSRPRPGGPTVPGGAVLPRRGPGLTFVEAGVAAVPRLSAAEVAALVATKQGGIAVCIPARDEAATIGAVVRTVDALRAAGLVDDLLV